MHTYPEPVKPALLLFHEHFQALQYSASPPYRRNWVRDRLQNYRSCLRLEAVHPLKLRRSFSFNDFNEIFKLHGCCIYDLVVVFDLKYKVLVNNRTYVLCQCGCKSTGAVLLVRVRVRFWCG